MARKKQKAGLMTAEKFETVYKSRRAIRFGDPIPLSSIGAGNHEGIPSRFNKPKPPKTHLVAPVPRVVLNGNETIKNLVSLLNISRYTYIDAINILSVPVFTSTLDAAVSECVNHNNIGRLVILLDMLKDSKWYKPLLLWACARCGIDFRIGSRIVRGGRITTSSAMQFFYATNATPRHVQLADYIAPANIGTLHTLLREQNRDKPGTRNSSGWWVRLNGSFGG